KELLLRAEEPEDVRLRDAGAAGDVLGRGAAVALLGELGERGVEDLLAPLLPRLPLRRNHRGGLVITHNLVKSLCDPVELALPERRVERQRERVLERVLGAREDALLA